MLSIISVTKNDFENLLLTFRSLCAQSCSDFEWVIIYSDSDFLFKRDFLDLIDSPEHNFSFSIVHKYINPSGIYSAMNLGISIASAPYILFLNSGDLLYSPTTLLFLFSCLRDSSFDLLLFAASYKFGSTSKTKSPLSPFSAYLFRFFSMPACHQAIVYKRKYILERNIRFSTAYQLCADFDHSVRLLSTKPMIATFDFILSTFDTTGISSKRPFLLFKESLSINFKYAPLTTLFFFAKQLLALSLFQLRVIFSRVND